MKEAYENHPLTNIATKVVITFQSLIPTQNNFGERIFVMKESYIFEKYFRLMSLSIHSIYPYIENKSIPYCYTYEMSMIHL